MAQYLQGLRTEQSYYYMMMIPMYIMDGGGGYGERILISRWKDIKFTLCIDCYLNY